MLRSVHIMYNLYILSIAIVVLLMSYRLEHHGYDRHGINIHAYFKIKLYINSYILLKPYFKEIKCAV